MQKEYLSAAAEVLSDQGVDENLGLSDDEASSRLAKTGPNKLEEAEKTPLWKRFFEQMADPMVIMLIVAAVISALTGMVKGEPDFADVVIIMFVVIVNSVLGVVQEAKSEEALEALQEMSAAQSKVMRDGKLYGLPVSLYTSGMGVNADTMEKLGLTQDDLPTTWLEFLDFAANFYYDYGEENADVALMDLNMRRPLFQMICKQYVAAQLRDTGSISFDTPLFRKLMQALEAIDFTELDPYEVKGDKVWEGDDANEFYEKQQLFTSYAEATPRSMGQSGYGSVNQPLILSLDGETEPIVPVSMTVMIVNPRSTRIDQAAAYLTAYAGHYEAETENIMFFPDQNDPVPNSYYEVQKQSYEESLQDLDSRIEKADESEKASLRDNREQIQGFLDELENQRMSVTEEMIQAYREQVAPYLYVTPQTPLTNPDSSAELDTLTRQYLDRAIDLDTYIREMDQRVRMMMLEDM